MPIRIVDLTTDDSSAPEQPRPEQSPDAGRSLTVWLLVTAVSLLVGLAAGWGVNCLLLGGCL